MITPRTSASGDVGGARPRTCHRCGQPNSDTAGYCLGCGTRLRDSEDATGGAGTPSGPAAAVSAGTSLFDESLFDDGDWDDDWDDASWERSTPSPAYASTEGPAPAFEHSGAETADARWVTDQWSTGEHPVVDQPGGLARIYRMRMAGLVALTVAFLAIVVLTFTRGDTTQNDASTTTEATLLTGTDAQIYAAIIQGYAGDAVAYGERAVEVNSAWDAQTTEYADALAALEALDRDVADFTERVRSEVAPEGLDGLPHARLLASATTLSQAAGGMVEGLKAPDDGQIRKDQLTRFSAAVDEFNAVANTIVAAIDVSG